MLARRRRGCGRCLIPAQSIRGSTPGVSQFS
jgi:hypothetical protein